VQQRSKPGQAVSVGENQAAKRVAGRRAGPGALPVALRAQRQQGRQQAVDPIELVDQSRLPSRWSARQGTWRLVLGTFADSSAPLLTQHGLHGAATISWRRGGGAKWIRAAAFVLLQAGLTGPSAPVPLRVRPAPADPTLADGVCGAATIPRRARHQVGSQAAVTRNGQLAVRMDNFPEQQGTRSFF